MDFYSFQNNSITDLQKREHAGKFHGKVLATVVREKRTPFLFKELDIDVLPRQMKSRSLLSFKFIERVMHYLSPGNAMKCLI